MNVNKYTDWKKAFPTPLPEDAVMPDGYCEAKTSIESHNFKTTGPLLNPAMFLG